MSINQYYSSEIPQLSAWPCRVYLHEEDEEEEERDMNNNNNNIGLEEEKEGMFEKPLTPSDVGKLNRLVIPKQHAEKYFPLADHSSSENNTKGVSLSFEDESGKCWRFRYSYWNSSQSYVLTKGWSRYVKDKRLHAGDVVFFLRHRTHSNRLFIHCRRRRPPPSDSVNTTTTNNNTNNLPLGWTTTNFYSAHHHHHPYPTHPHAHHHAPFSTSLHAGGGVSAGDDTKATSLAVGNSTSSRVLRLFGVNMECQPDQSGSSIPECSSTPTQHHHFYAPHNYYHHQPSYSSSNPMDINQMRNRRG